MPMPGSAHPPARSLTPHCLQRCDSWGALWAAPGCHRALLPCAAGREPLHWHSVWVCGLQLWCGSDRMPRSKGCCTGLLCPQISSICPWAARSAARNACGKRAGCARGVRAPNRFRMYTTALYAWSSAKIREPWPALLTLLARAAGRAALERPAGAQVARRGGGVSAALHACACRPAPSRPAWMTQPYPNLCLMMRCCLGLGQHVARR